VYANTRPQIKAPQPGSNIFGDVRQCGKRLEMPNTGGPMQKGRRCADHLLLVIET